MTITTTLLQSVWITASSVENHKRIAAHLLAANKYLEVTPVVHDGSSVIDNEIVDEVKCDGNPLISQA